MQTFTDHNGQEWPLVIEVNGQTLILKLLDSQTGDSLTPDQAIEAHHPDSLKWLDVIYKEY